MEILVSGAHFGLLSARIVVGHDRRYAFSTIPLVFVLALLETIRTTRRMLRAAHERSAHRREAFRFPPVLVVLETNYAYGAAVYIQMLQMLDDKQARHADLRGVDIVFATPVYGWDLRLLALASAHATAAADLAAAVADAKRLEDAVVAAWAWARGGKRRRNMNKQEIITEIRRTLAAEGDVREITTETVLPLRDIEAEVVRVVNRVIERVLRHDASEVEREELLRTLRTDFGSVLSLLARFLVPRRCRLKVFGHSQ
jgi:hypothetical protein